LCTRRRVEDDEDVEEIEDDRDREVGGLFKSFSSPREDIRCTNEGRLFVSDMKRLVEEERGEAQGTTRAMVDYRRLE
jgi:hypothetical protein